MPRNQADLSPRQARAAVLIASGMTVQAVAAETGDAARTVYRWTTEPPFRAEVAKLRDGMLEQATGRLSEALCRAADAMIELLGDRNAGVRLKASKAVLDSVLKARAFAELADRVAALEERNSERGNR